MLLSLITPETFLPKNCEVIKDPVGLGTLLYKAFELSNEWGVKNEEGIKSFWLPMESEIIQVSTDASRLGLSICYYNSEIPRKFFSFKTSGFFSVAMSQDILDELDQISEKIDECFRIGKSEGLVNIDNTLIEDPENKVLNAIISGRMAEIEVKMILGGIFGDQ